MSTAPTVPVQPPPPEATEREFTVVARSQWQLVRIRFFRHRLAMGSMIVLAIVVIGAFVVPMFWHYSYSAQDAPLSTGPRLADPFGTDNLGHDVLAQILEGIQTSLKVAVVGVGFGEIAGVVIGAVAGFYRGWIEALLMRAMDVVLTFPAIVLAAVLAKVAGSSWWIIALILGGIQIGSSARLVRSVVLSLREREYVEAARALGASDSRIMSRHLIPNALGPIIVDTTLNLALIILSEAALSFLGFGIQPPHTSLGLLVSAGVGASDTRPWLFYFPGLVIIVLVLTINFIGDGLRDAFDPTQQRVRA